MKKFLLFIICLSPTLIAMEPPSEKKRKQEITADIVPTPTKKTKIAQAIEGDFTLFVELPEEIQEYIVFQNASTFEQAIKNIQVMMQTNRKWRDTINNNVAYIVALIAKKFQVSELLAAFYLNTYAAQDFIENRLINNKKNMKKLLDYALKEAIERFDNSVRSQKLINAIWIQGAMLGSPLLREKDGTFLYGTNNQIKKINPDGSDDNTFSLPLPAGTENVHQIIKDTDGSLYVSGNTSENNSVIVKYLSTGVLDKNFGNEGIITITKDILTSFALLPGTGNILVVGENKANEKAIISLYTSKGEFLKEIMNFSDNSRFTTICLTNSGSYIALGYSADFISTEIKIIIQEFTQNLQMKPARYEETEENIATALLYQQPNGNIVIAGIDYITDLVQIILFDKTLKKLAEFTTEIEED